ncbi:MAG: TolC family protein [Candidatus Omnitrophota bacterium]
MRLKIMILSSIIFALSLNVRAEEKVNKITLEEFIKISCQKDTAFQEVLIDELKLKYEKALAIPAKDLVLEIESKYEFLFDPSEEDVENTVTLTKLFPYIGTEVAAEYSSSVATTTRNVTSDLTLEISQPIARDAFGRNTRLIDKITGIEIDVARYQIAEAYEDYLANVIMLYYDWYSAYENLRTAENSYKENLKLLENIKEREKSKIALPIDVNKITLQALAKRENVITRKNQYEDYLNEVKVALRYGEDIPLEPKESLLYADLDIDFEKGRETFNLSSRTAKVLKMLEDKSSFEVDEYADELLPSINLLMGYTLEGSSHDIEKETLAYAGVSLEWPFPDQVDRADYETSKIELRKTKLSSETTHMRLYTDLKNLDNQIQREKELIEVADEKIKLAEAIVKDEKENYSLGRSSLNDLIDEVNKLEDNKFNKITHNIQLRKLTVEWLRLSDTLIKESDIFNKQ